MTPAELSLTHLDRPAVVASAAPPLLLLLHSVGGKERDLFVDPVG